METQTPVESLPVQRVRRARRQDTMRRPIGREVASERDKTFRGLHSKTAGVLVIGPEKTSRTSINGASTFALKQAHQPGRTKSAATPFLEHKVPMPNEWGSTPSRGQDDVYKGKEEERLFNGNGRVTVPSQLIKRAGGKQEDESDGEGAENGAGDRDEDDRQDGDEGEGDDSLTLAEAKDVDDSDEDPLEDYVNTEDDDAWLKEELGRQERAVACLKRIRDERWAQLMKTVEEQNREDEEWFNGLATFAKSLTAVGILPSFNNFQKLIAMMRYQSSQRLAMREDTIMVAMHQEAPLIYTLEQLCACVLLYSRQTKYHQPEYWLMKKHCKLILGTDNRFANQMSSGVFDNASGLSWPPFAQVYVRSLTQGGEE